MITKQQFYNITQQAIEINFKGLFGDIEDENGELYGEVYRHELRGIYEDIGSFLNRISHNEDLEVITLEQLTGVLLHSWECIFGLDNMSVKVFKKIANFILISTERVSNNPNYISKEVD